MHGYYIQGLIQKLHKKKKIVQSKPSIKIKKEKKTNKQKTYNFLMTNFIYSSSTAE